MTGSWWPAISTPMSAAQAQVDAIWNDKRKWNAMAIRNTAHMGFFSSDRTIRQYAEEIWGVTVPKA